MKKLLTLSLILICVCSFGQVVNIPKAGNWQFVDETTPTDSIPCQVCPKGDPGEDGKTPIVKVGTTSTLPAGSSATVIGIPTTDGVLLNFGIPQGLPGSGTGSGTLPRGYIIVNARGDGVTDDTNAIQAAIDEWIRTDGYLIFPKAPNFYKITRTLNWFSTTDNQFWGSVQMYAQQGGGIVYMGPSGQPAIKMYGQKGGVIQGMQVKIGDGIEGSACWSIGTEGSATSTSCFSFKNCTVEPGKGINNKGWLVGAFGGGGDVSQILWDNCLAWGYGGAQGNAIAGQSGWQFNGNNSLQFSWLSGGAAYLNHAVEINAGGAMYFYGFGGSQNAVDFYMNHANTLTIDGNRWESGKQFLVVTGANSHPSIKISNSVIADYRPANGRIIEIRRPGTYVLDAVKIEGVRPTQSTVTNYGSEMIYMENSAMGSLFVRGGAFHANEPFYTIRNPGTVYLDIKGVGKMDSNNNTPTQFINK